MLVRSQLISSYPLHVHISLHHSPLLHETKQCPQVNDMLVSPVIVHSSLIYKHPHVLLSPLLTATKIPLEPGDSAKKHLPPAGNLCTTHKN